MEMMEFDYAAMGRRVRERRCDRQMTQEKLAERTGISTSFVGHIERGEKKPSIETIVTLSNVLDNSLDYLLTGRKNRCGGMRCELYDDLLELVRVHR